MMMRMMMTRRRKRRRKRRRMLQDDAKHYMNLFVNAPPSLNVPVIAMMTLHSLSLHFHD